MTPFKLHDGVAAPLDQPNVDTDQILPARFMRLPRSTGYDKFLFRDMRFLSDDSENAAFVLNQPAYRSATILVADRNFGGGSSREQAPWALLDYGIRCVIAADFGEIFYNNAFKAGLLPLQLPAQTCELLRQGLHASPGARLRVDLPMQTVTAQDGGTFSFDIDPMRKRMLLEGLDDVGLTLREEATIKPFEDAYRARFDWLFHPESHSH